MAPAGSKPAYKYRAKVERVLDGDSADVIIDVGFKISIHERIRFYGIDTPETRSKDPKERKKAKEVREYVKEAIEGRTVLLETFKQGKFGRYLGKIYYERIEHPAVEGEMICLNDELIKKGMAKEYWGGKR